MITPAHLSFNALIYVIFLKTGIISFHSLDLFFILSAELIDLDHLTANPIYHPKRNSFKTHFLHKKWRYIILLAAVFLFFRATLFLGIALISHLFVDFLENNIKKIK